jgi:hypothetical protein
MYSTSDTLDNTSGEYNGVVCVYVTVYTPIVKNGQVISYEIVTESIRGYCSEIYYSSGNRVGSFSTDTWCDSVALYNLSRWTGRETFNRELNENEKLNYSVYNNPKNGNNDTSVTRPYGKSLSTVLKNEF